MLKKSITHGREGLTGTAILGQSGPESNNEVVLHTPQNWNLTIRSSFVSYLKQYIFVGFLSCIGGG